MLSVTAAEGEPNVSVEVIEAVAGQRVRRSGVGPCSPSRIAEVGSRHGLLVPFLKCSPPDRRAQRHEIDSRQQMSARMIGRRPING
jgi:hypothetical protein